MVTKSYYVNKKLSDNQVRQIRKITTTSLTSNARPENNSSPEFKYLSRGTLATGVSILMRHELKKITAYTELPLLITTSFLLCEGIVNQRDIDFFPTLLENR